MEITVGERAHMATPDHYFQQPRKSSLANLDTSPLKYCDDVGGVLFALRAVITEITNQPYAWKTYRI